MTVLLQKRSAIDLQHIHLCSWIVLLYYETVGFNNSSQKCADLESSQINSLRYKVTIASTTNTGLPLAFAFAFIFTFVLLSINQNQIHHGSPSSFSFWRLRRHGRGISSLFSCRRLRGRQCYQAAQKASKGVARKRCQEKEAQGKSKIPDSVDQFNPCLTPLVCMELVCMTGQGETIHDDNDDDDNNNNDNRFYQF